MDDECLKSVIVRLILFVQTLAIEVEETMCEFVAGHRLNC